MIQISPGDLVGVRANERYYYALVLDRVRLFGGNWVFAFHTSSAALLEAGAVLSGSTSGFHAFVDFIFAKREGRLVRLARKQATDPFRGPGFLKSGVSVQGRPATWTIRDMSFNEVRRVRRLSAKEAGYPDYRRIDDTIMVEQIDARWTPDVEPRPIEI